MRSCMYPGQQLELPSVECLTGRPAFVLSPTDKQHDLIRRRPFSWLSRSSMLQQMHTSFCGWNLPCESSKSTAEREAQV